jgi:DNA-binding XRE family transcriptional regulator
VTKQGGWPPSGFGRRLRHLREQSSLSQRELADKTGCHWMTIAKLEREVQEPAWPLVLALARALGVECQAFVNAGTQMPAAGKRLRGRPPRHAPTERAATAGLTKGGESTPEVREMGPAPAANSMINAAAPEPSEDSPVNRRKRRAGRRRAR